MIGWRAMYKMLFWMYTIQSFIYYCSVWEKGNWILEVISIHTATNKQSALLKLLLESGGLAYQGKDIVFRFIIEYISLRDFGSY